MAEIDRNVIQLLESASISCTMSTLREMGFKKDFTI